MTYLENLALAGGQGGVLHRCIGACDSALAGRQIRSGVGLERIFWFGGAGSLETEWEGAGGGIGHGGRAGGLVGWWAGGWATRERGRERERERESTRYPKRIISREMVSSVCI